MSKQFYRDVKVIKFCKVCGVEFRPKRYSFFATVGLCWKHRRDFYKKWRIERTIPFMNNLSPEARERYRKMDLKRWIRWVQNNKERRRQQSLASYHRHKNDPKNKLRKHRTTQKPSLLQG